MDYQVESFLIIPNKNLIVCEGIEHSIRPKTLALLLFFIQHKDDITSKQELLDQVWQSAGAKEHVLFQSIKEIRSIFSGLTVIKTHPNVGYQWLVEVAEVAPAAATTPATPTIPTKKNNKYTTYGLFAFMACIALFAVIFLINPNIISGKLPLAKAPELKVSVEKLQKPSREIVVLPIENHIADSSHDWVSLGAMDMMINELTSKQLFAVIPSEDVMMVLARSDSFDITDIEQKSQLVRSQIGEAVTLHSKLLGTPMEYQLHFSLVGRHQIKQGIIFANKIPALLEKLTAQVMQHYQLPYEEARIPIKEQVANHNFLKAMELFHRQDFKSAIHHLATVLETKSNNLEGQRYLLKAHIATSNFSEALIIGERALVMAEKQQNMQEVARITFELGVLASLTAQPDKAHKLLSKSRQLANQYGDKLYTAFSYTELGHLLRDKKQFEQAEFLYQTAFDYHVGFACPYGQITNLTALATLYQQQNMFTQAKKKLEEAIVIADTNTLVFEHSYLLVNKIQLFSKNPEREQWFLQAKSLIETLDNSPIKQQLLMALHDSYLPITQKSKNDIHS